MKAWLDSLSERDRRILMGGGALALALLAWALVWDPLQDSRASLRDRAAANEASLQWMRPAAEKLAASGGADPAPAADGRSLLARVDANARAAGLSSNLASVEPQGNDRVRVQFSGADFDTLATWLERESAAGLRIEELSVQRAAGSGRVDARLTLRGGAP